MELDDTLCYCFRIPKRKIVNYVRRERPTYASQISECFGAGSACGWCIPELLRLHAEIVGGHPHGPDLTAEEYESMRMRYLQELKGGGEKNSLPPRPE